MSLRSPSSFAGSDTTADSIQRRSSKKRIMATPFLAQSKTEAFRPRSCLISTSKRIPAFKDKCGQPITSSYTMRITSTPTCYNRVHITLAISTFVRRRRSVWCHRPTTPTWLASVLDATLADTLFRRMTTRAKARASVTRHRCWKMP